MLALPTTELEPAPLLLNCRGRLLDLTEPQVMGIVNLTPDSFSDGGMVSSPSVAVERVGQLLAEGAGLIDIGAVSSRPGAPEVTAEEELRRLTESFRAIREAFPKAFLSVDTSRAEVARQMIEWGADMINDITAGADPEMFAVVAQARVPIVLMHMQGAPATMQQAPSYQNVAQEVRQFLIGRINAARAAGVADVLVDPGFGFGKTLTHNLALIEALPQFATLGLPLLVGFSRKSLITRGLGITQSEAGPATAALHDQALRAGARVLRVHEVAEAVSVVRLSRLQRDSALPVITSSHPS